MNYQQNDFNTYYYKPNKLVKAFSSPLFLAVAVLTSAMAVFIFDVFAILGTIAAWLIYSTAFNAAKNPGTPIKTTGFSMVNGTVRALKIVYLVFSIIMIVCGIVLFVLILRNSDYILSMRAGHIYDIIKKYITDPEMYFEVSTAYDEILAQLFADYGFPSDMFGYLLFVTLITASVSLVFSGVFQLVLSLTFCAKLYRFTCSLRDCAEHGGEPQRIKGLGVWFLVLGILEALASPLVGGLLIVLYVWYKMFFPAEPDIRVNV